MHIVTGKNVGYGTLFRLFFYLCDPGEIAQAVRAQDS